MKNKNCKENQIINPETNRCIKKDTKKGIEILFKQKDKNILKLYELINGKILKKCEKPKIRNPETNKCVKEKKALKEKNALKEKKALKEKALKSLSLNKKIDAIKKAKKALSPFINRVSVDIYRRNRYYIMMKRELKDKKIGCLKIYKKNSDGSYSYRIGNRIILKKRIGSDSVYGIVYLSEFRENEKKLFTFASKVYEYKLAKTSVELILLNKLTKLVRMDLCPHYPIFYGYKKCNIFSLDAEDSFIKSNMDDKSQSQNYVNFPKLLQKNIGNDIITTFNELANGDLYSFFRTYGNNAKYLINGLIQQIISIIFFNYHTNRIHKDTHAGNFLYHKVKAGGYFHYNIFGVDYYLENLGFLWVIWDFDLSYDIDYGIQIINNQNLDPTLSNDFMLLIRGYISHKLHKAGYNENIDMGSNDELQQIALNFYKYLLNFYYFKMKLSKKFIIDYILTIPEYISNIKINGNNFLLKSLPKGGKVINKKPYIINKKDFFQKSI